MKGATTTSVHAFKRSLEASAAHQQHQHQHQQANGGGGGGERLRVIGFHKPRNPKNGFVSLSTLKAGGVVGRTQHQHQQPGGKVGGWVGGWELVLVRSNLFEFWGRVYMYA